MNAQEYQWILETLQDLKKYSDGCGFRGLSGDLKTTLVRFEYEYAEFKLAQKDERTLRFSASENSPVRKH